MKMQNAEMEFIQLDAGDVIATSGIVTLSGLYDSIPTNATISFNGTEIYNAKDIDLSVSNAASKAALSALRGALNTNDIQLDSYFYKKDLTSSAKFSDPFKTSISSMNGDSGNTEKASMYSWLNESTFQWLNGNKGWGFYQQ